MSLTLDMLPHAHCMQALYGICSACTTQGPKKHLRGLIDQQDGSQQQVGPWTKGTTRPNKVYYYYAPSIPTFLCYTDTKNKI